MTLRGDVRFAFRQLRRTPVFTAIVLATLGLCIGVNTAVYSVLDAVLLRPAPYPDAHRVG
jgi:putative ABC transport system permease protein